MKVSLLVAGDNGNVERGDWGELLAHTYFLYFLYFEYQVDEES